MKLTPQEINNTFYGYDAIAAIEDTATQIVEYLIPEYNKETDICFVIGKGLNGTDGLCIASKLIQKGYTNISIISPYAKETLHEYSQKYTDTIANALFQTQTLPKAQVYIEALIGSGFEGSTVKRPIKTIQSQLKKTKQFVISIDTPLGTISPDICLSIDSPKVRYSKIFTSVHTKRIESFIGPGDFYSANSIKKPRFPNNILLFSNQKPQLSKSFVRLSYTELKTVSYIEIRKGGLTQQQIDSIVERNHVIIFDLSTNTYLIALIIKDITERYPSKKYIFVTNTKTLPKCNILSLQESIVISTRESFSHKLAQTVVNLKNARVVSFNGKQKSLPNIFTISDELTIDFAIVLGSFFIKTDSFAASTSTLFVWSVANKIEGNLESRLNEAQKEIKMYIESLK